MTQQDTKAPSRFLTPTKDITELRVFFTQARPTLKSRVNNRVTDTFCKIFLLSWFAFYLSLLLIDFMPLSAPFKGSYFSSDRLSCPFSSTINRHILYWNRCSALKFWCKLQKRKKHFCRRFLTKQHTHSLPQAICLG